MPSKFPPTLDLSLVRSRLLAAGELLPVANKIGQALTAQSCVADLREADECCGALDHLLASPRGQGTRRRNATEAALLATATSLYARATATSGQKGERGSVQITAQLDPDQRVDHDIIVGVRNRALAHVYTNEEVQGALWHSGAILLVWQGHGWRPASATNRVQLDRTLLRRLQRQVPVALGLVTDRARQRLDDAAKAVGEALATEAMRRATADAEIDLEQFFGSRAVAEEALRTAADPSQFGMVVTAGVSRQP